MIEQLSIPFHYDYMLKAMWVSALIGTVCGLLSCFITLKGWSLMGDALSHAIVPGVAVAYLLGAPFALGAFLSGLLAAAGMGFVKARTSLREDAVIGVVFTTFFAVGVLIISLNAQSLNTANAALHSRPNLQTIVFGNILGISGPDVLQVAIISALTLLVLGLKWRDLVLFCFDPQQASALGFSAFRLHLTLLTLLAATAVASMQTVGAVLVVATLVTPGATAYLLTDRFSRMLGIAGCIGFGTSSVGAYLSYFFNGSTGGCIVVLQTLCFLAAFVFAPKHGMLANRAKRRRAVEGFA